MCIEFQTLWKKYETTPTSRILSRYQTHHCLVVHHVAFYICNLSLMDVEMSLLMGAADNSSIKRIVH